MPDGSSNFMLTTTSKVIPNEISGTTTSMPLRVESSNTFNE